MKSAIKKLTQIHLIPSRINKFWIIYYSVGIAGFTFPQTRDLFTNLTGFSILLSTILMFWFHRPWSLKFMAACVFVFLGGILIETIGVNSGVVFGEYQYGATLGPKIMNTPILIGINWLMLIYIVWQLVREINTHIIGQLFIGSSLMAGYDLFLEPVAIATDMWSWGNNAVPHQNYLAWFVISFVFLGVFRLAGTRYKNPVAPGLLAAQIAFFFLLNLIL